MSAPRRMSRREIEYLAQRDDLAMMLRRIIWQINKNPLDYSGLKVLAGNAGQLLEQYGLQGSVLR